jgi:molybdopterin molybdotransferase
MIPVHEAERILLESTPPALSSEWVSLSAAHQRILAEEVISPAYFPAGDTSSMDGYAVQYEDVKNLTSSVALSIIETIPAGSLPSFSLRPGQATRLFTGSLLPDGADTILLQEYTERLSENTVRILPQATEGYYPGRYIRRRGSFCQTGDSLMQPGLKLGGSEIAVLAALQRSSILVYRQPRVALISTGHELVRIDQTLHPGQLVDSNQHGLRALVAMAGGVPLALGIVQDNLEQIRAVFEEALSLADVVISSGGVSVGDYDLVERALDALGGEIRIRQVAIKPGKPLTFATFPGSRLFLGLPGNPVSALVTFWRFAYPVLTKLQGHEDHLLRVSATTEKALSSDGKRETYIWGKWDPETTLFQPQTDQTSGNLIQLAGCNALAILPMGCQSLSAGGSVEVMLINR